MLRCIAMTMGMVAVLAGCQAAVVRWSTFGPPSFEESYAGENAAFGNCVKDSFPHAVVGYDERHQRTNVSLPDVGSYRFYIEISQVGKNALSIKSWVAGWLPEMADRLRERYRHCATA